MRIYFKEDTHQYLNDKNETYISVSDLTKRLEKKKNWDLIKKKFAEKNGLTVREVTEMWNRARTLGSSAGIKYHAQREQELLDSEFIYEGVTCAKKSCTQEDGLKISLSIEKLDDNTVYPELMIYDHEYKVCGQSDKIIVANGRINLIDYKTDKSIERRAFFNDHVKPEKFLKPVSHLENCNFNMYSLKMSIYMYMLWKYNKHLKIGEIILEHVQLNRDEKGIPILESGKPTVKSIENIHVPYRRKEVKDIFEFYKNGKL